MMLLQTILLALVHFLFLICQGKHVRYIADPNDPICKAPLDLIVIVEEGCSYMDEPKCVRLKQHLIDLTFHFQVGRGNKYARIGVISYGPTPHVRVPLISGVDTKSIVRGIEDVNCDAPSGPSNDLVSAIESGLREFSKSTRYILGRKAPIPQAMIIYPSCDCTMNATLCKADNPKTNALLKKLSNKQVAIYTSGRMTSAQDYMCLVTNSNKNNFLFDNQKCDTLPYIYDAHTLTRLYCPEGLKPFSFFDSFNNLNSPGNGGSGVSSSSSSSSSSSDGW